MRATLVPSRPRTAATDRTSRPLASNHTAHAAPLASNRSHAAPLASNRSHARRRTASHGLFALALLLACAPPPVSSPPPPPAQATAPTRTANNDARGAGVQPDYDGEAVLLREQLLPRLPDPLPADRRSACTEMLDAAATFYAEIESAAAPRAQLQADLKTTRDAELLACERETSIRAASCVRLRLADRDAELPWLLDQCSRAFPD
jgi:hypothetical protein